MGLKRYYVENNFLILEEDHQGMSLTNCIEDVYKEIIKHNESYKNLKVIYQDTEGTWDGCTIKNGHAQFIHLGEKSKEEAIKKI